MEKYLKKWKELLNNVKEKIEKAKLEEQELAGNIIKNEENKIVLAEVCDLSRIRYDYGIKLKNDNLVKVKSDLLIIDDNGILYFLDKKTNEELEVGKVEENLYEFDVYKQEWKKADIVSILACANFSIKNTKLKEIDKRILENRDNEFYTDISKKHNKLKLGGMIANEQY